MKLQSRIVLALLVVAIGFGLAPSRFALAHKSQQQAQFAVPIMVVNTSFLNIRTGPSAEYTVLVTVVGGTELPVLGVARDEVWYQVSTVAGVGWINSEFAIARGDFSNVPVVTNIPQALPAAVTVTGTGLSDGQGGFTASVVDSRANTRAVITVDAVNLQTEPRLDSAALTTIFRDDAKDYAIVGQTTDRENIQWLSIEVPGNGTGWIPASQVRIRLSGALRTVIVVTAEVVAMTSAPNGNSLNLPVLTGGQEGYLVGISPDSNFIQIELGDGTVGWIPFSAGRTRTETQTDEFGPANGFTPEPAAVTNSTTTSSNGTSAVIGRELARVIINTSFLNVRSGPGAQFTSVATVNGGTELTVLGIASDNVWFLVQGTFGQGWVNNEFVIFRGSINNVPVIRNADAIGSSTLAAPVAVVASSVQLYAAPGTQFGSVGTLTGPIEVAIVARNADFSFIQLRTPNGFGWALASQVTVRGDTSLIPVVT